MEIAFVLEYRRSNQFASARGNDLADRNVILRAGHARGHTVMAQRTSPVTALRF